MPHELQINMMVKQIFMLKRENDITTLIRMSAVNYRNDLL